MKADTIIQSARKALVDIIIGYLRKIDGFMETGDKRLRTEGEVNLYDEDFITENMPVIEVEVDNSYLDVEDYCTERRKITQFIVSEDGELSFCIKGDNKEIPAKNATIEELARIANFPQNEWETM